MDKWLVVLVLFAVGCRETERPSEIASVPYTPQAEEVHINGELRNAIARNMTRMAYLELQAKLTKDIETQVRGEYEYKKLAEEVNEATSKLPKSKIWYDEISIPIDDHIERLERQVRDIKLAKPIRPLYVDKDMLEYNNYVLYYEKQLKEAEEVLQQAINFKNGVR